MRSFFFVPKVHMSREGFFCISSQIFFLYCADTQKALFSSTHTEAESNSLFTEIRRAYRCSDYLKEFFFFFSILLHFAL